MKTNDKPSCNPSRHPVWRKTMGLALLVAALSGGWISPTLATPTIDNDFLSNATADVDRSTILQLLDDSPSITVTPGTEAFKIYSAFSQQKVRYDFTNPYQIVLEVPSLASVGLFDFLADAFQWGTCSWQGRSGSLWRTIPAGSGPVTETDLCANGNVPILMTWILAGGDSVKLHFNTFTKGTPAASNFVPEPAALPLMALALVSWAVVRRLKRV